MYSQLYIYYNLLICYYGYILNNNVAFFLSIGYPVVTLGFGFKSYVSYKMRLRKQKEVQKENEFYMQLLQQALPPEQQMLQRQEREAEEGKLYLMCLLLSAIKKKKKSPLRKSFFSPCCFDESIVNLETEEPEIKLFLAVVSMTAEMNFVLSV